MKTKIGVNGACGRMGQRIIQLAHEDKSLALAAAVDSLSHPGQGNDVGETAGVGKLGVHVTASIPLSAHLDVIEEHTRLDAISLR